MDFPSMKRRELQALCKKNMIPANLSNLEMASKLTELFQEKKRPSTRGRMKEQDNDKSGTESNMVMHREAKKVRFSPEHELIEFTRSREKTRRSKRISALGDNILPAVHVDKAGWKNRKVDCPARITQSREKFIVNGVLNGNKRSRNRVNNNHDRDDEVVDSVGVERIPEEILDDHRRVTRSGGKKLVESLVREKRRGEYNGIAVGNRRSLRNRGVVDEGKLDRYLGVMVKNNEKRREQILDGTMEVTSSRGKKLVKSLVREKRRDEDNGIAVGTRRSLRNRGVVDEGKLDRDSGVILKNNEKRQENILEDKVTAKENTVVACQNLSRRSKKKSKIVDDSEVFKHDIGKHENGSSMSSRNTIKSLAVKVSEVEVETVYVKGKLDAGAVEHSAEIAQQLMEPGGQGKLKRSCWNPFKNKSPEVIDELGEDVVIQQKTQARKRTRGHISGESFRKPDNDTRLPIRSKMETRGNEKTVSASVVDKFADQIKLLNSLKEPNLLEDSSSKGVLENGELLCGKAQLSMPDTAEGSKNTNAKKFTCNKRLASIRKHHRKDKETSASVCAGMKSIDISETMSTTEDPASEISDLQKDSSESEIGISGSKLMDAEAVRLLPRVAEHEIFEKTMSDDKNSEPVVQVFGQSESLINETITGNQKILEASNIPGNLAPETGLSADGLVLADLEVTEAKADDKVQSNSPVLDHNQMKDVSAEENLETFEPINETHLLTGCHNHMEASNNVDMGQKMGEAGAFEPRGEGLINSTDSRSALEMKEASSGKLGNSYESNHMPEGANILVTNDTHSESDEAGESRNTKDLKLISDDNIEFGVSIPFDGGRSARTNWQDSEMCSAEYFIKDSDKDGKFHDPPVEVPASMLANSIGHERGRSLEVCQVDEGYETNVCYHAHSELAETKEGRCLKDHMSVTDEDDRLSASAQFDDQRGACIMPQDCVSCSDECSIKEPGRQGTFHDTEDTASTAMPAKHKDSKFTTGSSSLLDVNGSRSEASPKSEGLHATIFANCQIIENEAGVSNTMEEKGANVSGNEITGDQKSLVDQISNRDYEIFNQFESSKKTKYNPEPLKSPPEKTIVTPNAGKCEEALSSVSETAGHTMPIFKTARKSEVSNQLVDENANVAECNKEKDDFVDAQTMDVPMSMGGPSNKDSVGNKGEWKFQDIGKIENLSPNLIAHELLNLDEFTYKESCHGWQVDRVTSSGPKEASTHGTDKGNMTMSLPTDKRSTLPTTSKEGYDTGCYVGQEGYQLQFLFATPIKLVAPCKVDETSTNEKNAERVDLSFVECFGTTKENEVTQTKSDKKVEVFGNELENYIGLGNLMLANGKDIRNSEINDVNDGNRKPWNENSDENTKESNSLTTENVVDIVGSPMKASHENCRVIESKDLEMTSDNNELFGSKTDETDDHLTFSTGFLDELRTNNEITLSKSHFDGYTLDNDVLSTNDGIQKTCEERAFHHHSVYNMVTTAEHESTFWGNEPEMLQCLSTHLFVEENDCDNAKRTNMETSDFNMEGNQEVDGGGVPQQLFMSEFHLEGDLKSDIRTVSDSSACDCNSEKLEESHLDNTIKECLESEYSVAVLDDSGANLHNDLNEPQRGGTDERVDYPDDNYDKPSIVTESKEPEEQTLFPEPDEGFAMNEALVEKKLIIKDDRSAAKKNARTILIHGTPNKLFLADGMKENAPNSKRSQIGDYTTVRPIKRRALQDVRWK